MIAGGPDESVLEPRWGADGSLWFVSDRTDWWNLYRYTPGTDIATVVRIDAEIGVPPWQFGSARYAMLADGSVVFARPAPRIRRPRPPRSRRHGHRSGHAVLPGHGAARAAPTARVLVVAGSPTQEPGVHRIDSDRRRGRDAAPAARPRRRPRGSSRCPSTSAFPTDGGRTAHALFYPPAHPELDRAGGRAAAADRGDPRRPDGRGVAGVLDGRAVLDQPRVRRRRRQLRRLDGLRPRLPRGARRALGDRGRRRLPRRRPAPRPHRAGSTRSGSPSAAARRAGSPTLAALARDDTPFAAGADHFGVADLEALARDTHKFESRYLDRLVGPYPAARDVYVERSPIHHVDRLHPPADRAAGQRGRDRAARAERNDRRRAARAARSPSPTCSSRANSTASGARRTSAGRSTPSSPSTRRCWASTCPTARASSRWRSRTSEALPVAQLVKTGSRAHPRTLEVWARSALS